MVRIDSAPTRTGTEASNCRGFSDKCAVVLGKPRFVGDSGRTGRRYLFLSPSMAGRVFREEIN